MSDPAVVEEEDEGAVKTATTAATATAARQMRSYRMKLNNVPRYVSKYSSEKKVEGESNGSTRNLLRNYRKSVDVEKGDRGSDTSSSEEDEDSFNSPGGDEDENQENEEVIRRDTEELSIRPQAPKRKWAALLPNHSLPSNNINIASSAEKYAKKSPMMEKKNLKQSQSQITDGVPQGSTGKEEKEREKEKEEEEEEEEEEEREVKKDKDKEEKEEKPTFREVKPTSLSLPKLRTEYYQDDMVLPTSPNASSIPTSPSSPTVPYNKVSLVSPIRINSPRSPSSSNSSSRDIISPRPVSPNITWETELKKIKENISDLQKTYLDNERALLTQIETLSDSNKELIVLLKSFGHLLEKNLLKNQKSYLKNEYAAELEKSKSQLSAQQLQYESDMNQIILKTLQTFQQNTIKTNHDTVTVTESRDVNRMTVQMISCLFLAFLLLIILLLLKK